MYPIYEALLTKFESKKALFTNNGLIAPFIDIYQGQPLAPKEFEFTLPALFFDYSIDYKNNIFTLEAHVIDEFMEETDNHSPKCLEGLDHLRYLAICRYIINNTSAVGLGFKKLHIDSEKPVTTDYYYYHQINFQCCIDDLIDNSLIDFSTEEKEIDGKLIKGTIINTPQASIPIIVETYA